MEKTNQEIAAEALKRARVLLFQRKTRHQIVMVSTASLACLALIVATALSVGGAAGGIPGRRVVSGTLGALFLHNDALGYVVVGVLAFLLGIGVSLLAFLMRKRSLSRPDDGDGFA